MAFVFLRVLRDNSSPAGSERSTKYTKKHEEGVFGFSKSCWIDVCGLVGIGNHAATFQREQECVTELILKTEFYQIVGAAIEVHRHLGPGFLEPVYQEALEIELRRRAIPFQSQCRLAIHYKGEVLRKAYVADLICFGQIIAELKAGNRLTGEDEGQILNYMKATGKGVGLLFNFGSLIRLEWKRYVI
jgi:GxxExxY protein